MVFSKARMLPGSVAAKLTQIIIPLQLVRYLVFSKHRAMQYGQESPFLLNWFKGLCWRSLVVQSERVL